MSTRKASTGLKLDREEEELLLALEKGELKYKVATKAERAEAAAAARATLKRDKRMNIRVSSMDMLGLQTKAAKLGMPYQTLVSSVLHQYLTGRLKSSDT
jgi:predicted DNA binding CopG/RHH family protein